MTAATRRRPYMSRVADAAEHLTNVFDHYLADDVAVRFNCIEVEALADLLDAVQPGTGDAWRKAHAADDDQGDRHWNLNDQYDPTDHQFAGEPGVGDSCEWCGAGEDADPHRKDQDR